MEKLKINYHSRIVKYPTLNDFLKGGIYYKENFNFENKYDLPKKLIFNVFGYGFLNYFIEESFYNAKYKMYNDIYKLKRWILENIFGLNVFACENYFTFYGYTILCCKLRKNLIKHYFGKNFLKE